MSGTTTKGAPYPTGADPATVPEDIRNLAEWADGHPGISIATYAEINALTGADVWEGREIYQSNTGTNRPVKGPYVHNGVGWRRPWNMPWGVLPNGVATVDANQTGNGGETDIVQGGVAATGLTLTNVLVANRWIRATLRAAWSQNSSGTPVFYVHDGASHAVINPGAQASAATGRASGAYEFLSTAGSKVVKGRVSSAAGTVDVIASSANPARLVLEDIGPGGNPA